MYSAYATARPLFTLHSYLICGCGARALLVACSEAKRNWQLGERAHPVGDGASSTRRTNKEYRTRQCHRRLCLKPSRGRGYPKKIKYAGVAELADAQDLGSCVNSCRFKSCHPHQPTVSAPKYRVATEKIRTLSRDGGVRIYLYSMHHIECS